ncbi:MAG: ankyrin repeat domain-containing protein [Candidatus Babeliaceae bacterium]
MKKILFCICIFLSGNMASQTPTNQNLAQLIKGIEIGNFALVKSLFTPQKKIDVNVTFPFSYGTDIRQMTPLMLSVMFNNQAISEFLLSQGANINAADNHGNTPLMYAINPQGDKILALLLKNNPELNQTRPDGITALMMAAAWGYNTLVDMIVKKAQQQNTLPMLISLKDKSGKTALDYAKNPQIRNLLQKYINIAQPAATPQTAPAQPTQVPAQIENMPIALPSSIPTPAPANPPPAISPENIPSQVIPATPAASNPLPVPAPTPQNPLNIEIHPQPEPPMAPPASTPASGAPVINLSV